MKYRVLIDYKNFIPIEADELEKALKAFASDGKAIFKFGATERIHAILPDFHAMMGWNYGYTLGPEDYAEIGMSKECTDAMKLLSDTKLRLSTAHIERNQLSAGVKQIADAKRV